MREDDRPNRWDNPDPDRTDRLDGPDRPSGRDRPDGLEGHENERVIEERVVSRTEEQVYEPAPVEAPPPRAPPPARSYRWVGALILAAALIAAAFGAYALLNQERPSMPETTPSEPTPQVTAPNNTTNVTAPNMTAPLPVLPNATSPGPASSNNTTPVVLPPGIPAGQGNVSAAGVQGVAAGNVTALSPATFPQMAQDLQLTSIEQGSSDSLTRIAVANSGSEAVTLQYSGFLATLADGSTVAPTNAAGIVLPPGTTTFVTLGFPTGGQAISAISYSDGTTAFGVPYEGATFAPAGEPVTMQTPSGLVPNTDIGFASPDSWMSDDSLVVLVQATNNNPDPVAISPSDFWIDLGGGTWVQADGVNNNVPAALEPGETTPFLVGFSGVSGASPDQVWYWPGGPSLERIGIEPSSAAGTGAQLYQAWASDSADPAMQEVSFVLLNNGAAAINGCEIVAYTASGGVYNAAAAVAGTTDLPGNAGVGTVTVTFDVPRDDNIVLLSYVQNGETQYAQLG